MEEYIKILKLKGYSDLGGILSGSYAKDPIDKNKNIFHFVDYHIDNKIEIYGLNKKSEKEYTTGLINLDINEFRMLLDLFWREYETK